VFKRLSDRRGSVVYGVGIVFILWFLSQVYLLFYKPIGLALDNFTVRSNTSASALVKQLNMQGIYSSPTLLLMAIRIMGLSSKLQAGYYQINPEDTAWQLVQKIIHGDVIVKTFTIVEGTNFNQLMLQLSKTTYFNVNPVKFNELCKNRQSCEGLFLAETYQYQGGSTKQRILEEANRELWRVLNEQWSSRDKTLPYKTPYEMLIAASIIEKETAQSRERRLISGVIVNRLNKKMKLQMDPTVIYAMGKDYKGDITRGDLSRHSPFNTYYVKGLPPTPIAMVGKESIKAAAQPLKTNYLYFVAKGDGSHIFSVNYQQQQQAVKKYQLNGGLPSAR